MKKALLVSILFMTTGLVADCPMSRTCSLDGQFMMQKETYYNGSHKSIKYAHDYIGSDGKKVEHYIIVKCD